MPNDLGHQHCRYTLSLGRLPKRGASSNIPSRLSLWYERNHGSQDAAFIRMMTVAYGANEALWRTNKALKGEKRG